MGTYIKALVTLLCLAAMALNISCSKDGVEHIASEIVISTEEAQATPEKSTYDINAYPLNKLVCDPFDPNTPPTPKHGIKSSLWFRGFNQPVYTSVLDYMSKYTASEQTLFFNSVNVPTRMFHSGFPLETGDVVRDDLGTQLIEYFAMKFESQITLSENDTEGLYEIAILSDDGTILKIKEPDDQGVLPTNWETHINNDGDTATRMKCSSRLIDMKHGKKIPVELLYYQGPRYHISNMLIWRKASQAGKDAYCGHSGNEYFFNPNNNSAPVRWTNLAARGWRVLGSGNYLLPVSSHVSSENGDTDYNACYNGTPAKITDFRIIEQLSNEVSFSWRTNIKAISQILITNLDTGEKTVTQTDNVLRTSHQIVISGLQNTTNYRFQVIAISEDLGRSISSAIDLTTF
ncbi:MAG: fibronectin type III domain-containing protein [Bdellovibrionaceae bacterium]|nr:fibronectin type III domain-containing protein [Pseudobdellovibrionaceae bacterium]